MRAQFESVDDTAAAKVKIAAPLSFQLSAQQQAVLDWAANSTRSLNLVARAGCGKTSTLIELVKFLVARADAAHQPVEIFLGAFNRSIADEIKSRLQALGIDWRTCNASTMHSAGWSSWRKRAPQAEVERNKVRNICYALQNADAQSQPAADIELFGAAITKAVSFAKQRALGVLADIDSRKEWLDIIEHFAMEQDLPGNGGGFTGAIKDRFIDLCIRVYKLSLEQCKEIVDFDDMLLAPLYFGAHLWPKDWVLIDEAQDTNPARRELAMRMLKPRTGRLVAVGDDRQACYGFTGADSDSMDIIRKQLDSDTLPLNLTYRCPKSVVALAQSWVPDIEAAPSNPEGVVRTVHLEPPTVFPQQQASYPLFWSEQFTVSDVILCRNTAPLVELAYQFLRQGTACRVEGREIGEGLVKLATRWKTKLLSALVPKVEKYQEQEIKKLLARDKDELAAAVADRCETILILAQKLQADGRMAVQDLVDFVEAMFGNTNEGERQQVLTLSTIHKAKGREWDRVYLAGRNKFMPSRYARKDWQRIQEDNLCYIAVTRAKRELVEVIYPVEERKQRSW